MIDAGLYGINDISLEEPVAVLPEVPQSVPCGQTLKLESLGKTEEICCDDVSPCHVSRLSLLPPVQCHHGGDLRSTSPLPSPGMRSGVSSQEVRPPGDPGHGQLPAGPGGQHHLSSGQLRHQSQDQDFHRRHGEHLQRYSYGGLLLS